MATDTSEHTKKRRIKFRRNVSRLKHHNAKNILNDRDEEKNTEEKEKVKAKKQQHWLIILLIQFKIFNTH